jgi:hypothetical protein
MVVVEEGIGENAEDGSEDGWETVGERGDIWSSDEPANPPEKLAATEHEHQRKFRWWALIIIAALCAFFGVATLLVGALASKDESIRMASDVAKTSIPTLLTLLGTAVAWAFKSEKD